MQQSEKLERFQLEVDSADAYEQYLVPAIFAGWADRLLDLTPPRSGDAVLDVACGTGIVARRAAQRVGTAGRIAGVDLNAGMLEVAKRTATGIEPAIEWHQSSADDLPFPDGSFDRVYCQQAVQFFPDPNAALSEMHRVLAPGGRLAISIWRSLGHNHVYRTIVETFGRHVGDEAGRMLGTPFPSWDQETIRGIVGDGGFQSVRVLIGIGESRFPSVAEYLRQDTEASPLPDALASLDTDARTALMRDLNDRLASYVDDDGLVIPFDTHLVVADR
jgi:ubiquinone/menaquinone biosynthesis C-methylase UbiE